MSAKRLKSGGRCEFVFYVLKKFSKIFVNHYITNYFFDLPLLLLELDKLFLNCRIIFHKSLLYIFNHILFILLAFYFKSTTESTVTQPRSSHRDKCILLIVVIEELQMMLYYIRM